MSLWGFLTDLFTRPVVDGDPSTARNSVQHIPARITIYVCPLEYMVEYNLELGRTMVLEAAGDQNLDWHRACRLIQSLGPQISNRYVPDAIEIEVTHGEARILVQDLEEAFNQLLARSRETHRQQEADTASALREANGGASEYAEYVTTSTDFDRETRHIENCAAICAGTVVIAGLSVSPILGATAITAVAAASAAVYANPEGTGAVAAHLERIYLDAQEAVLDPESNLAITGTAAFVAATGSAVLASQAPLIFAAVATVSASTAAWYRVRNMLNTWSRVRNMLRVRRSMSARQRGGRSIFARQQGERSIQDSQPGRLNDRPPPEDREDAPKRQRRQ
jgi:hypothetical protein